MGVLYDILIGKEALDKISLKSLAEASGASMQRMYNISKQPVPGQPYDPKAINWDAIERFLNRRVELMLKDVPDGKTAEECDIPDNLEKVVDKAIELESYRSEVKGSNRSPATDLIQKPRKFSNFEMDAHEFVCLKNDPCIYVIVMQTETHTVLRPVKPENTDEFLNGSMRVISNNTMNQNAMGPSAIKGAVESRINGTYQVPDKKKKSKVTVTTAEEG